MNIHCETRKTVKTKNISGMLFRCKEKVNYFHGFIVYCLSVIGQYTIIIPKILFGVLNLTELMLTTCFLENSSLIILLQYLSCSDNGFFLPRAYKITKYNILYKE